MKIVGKNKYEPSLADVEIGTVFRCPWLSKERLYMRIWSSRSDSKVHFVILGPQRTGHTHSINVSELRKNPSGYWDIEICPEAEVVLP